MNGSHERDQSVERLLRQSFKTPQRGVTDACLDAETLAAWVDGGLSGVALEMAQSHVADCARCQSLVGALVRTNATVPHPEPAPRRWLAWLAPLTAAATAVALWIAVPAEKSAPGPSATDVQRQAAETNAAEPASVDSRPQASAPARAKEEQASQAKGDVAPALRDQAKVAELRRDAGRLEADRARKDSGEPTSAAAAAAPPVAPTGLEAAQARSANSLAETTSVRIVEIVTPDPAVGWRIVGNVVQHSTNGGSSWDEVSTGVAAELTAGVAPSTSVCWVVGRNGVVLLSTDGRSLSRVPFPEMTDLSAVRATDARTASVTTMDGRIFSTTDGGVTWERR